MANNAQPHVEPNQATENMRISKRHPTQPQPFRFTIFTDPRREAQWLEEEISAWEECREPWHSRLLRTNATPSSGTPPSGPASTPQTFEQKKEEAAACRVARDQRAALNPQLAEEREKLGKVGSPNPSLFRIPVVHMNGQHELKQYKYLVDFDWYDRKCVLGLNAWRYSVIHYYAGPIEYRQEPNAEGKPWSNKEERWLYKRTKCMGVNTHNVWDEIHQDFLVEFWEKPLPGLRGT